MPAPRTHRRAYSFGEFTLRVDEATLVQDAGEVKLRPKSFSVLTHLVEQHGRLVTKAELLNAIWGHASVTEGTLTKCLMDIRRALGDTSHRMIRTVPRRGYLFELSVTEHDDTRRLPAQLGGKGTEPSPSARPPGRQPTNAMAVEPFRLDKRRVTPSANEIDGQRIDSKAMDLLVCLAQAAPEVVSHADLLERVWPNVVVGDNVLRQAIARLRSALSDYARAPCYIENIPRRGYRLLANVQREAQARDEARAGDGDELSIVVLPFANMSSEQEQGYFSDGLSEELINALAHHPQLKVTSRTSGFHFRAADVRTIARELGVTHVLEGSVRKSGEAIRVSVQLIEARSDTHVWSETYDRMLGDIFALQDEIAAGVFKKLKVTLLGAIANRHAPDPKAYLRYLEARRLLDTHRPDAVHKARDLLDETVTIDPGFVRGWAELARAHGRLGDRQAAERYSRRAASVDPDDPSVNVGLGWPALVDGQDLERSAAVFSRAVAADPTSIEVWRGMVPLLNRLGRFSEAVGAANWVLDRDPMCQVCRVSLGLAHLGARRFVEAEQTLTVGMALAPESPHVRAYLAWSQLLQGKARAALSTIEDFADPHPAFPALRALICRQLGDPELLPGTLAKLESEGDEQAFSLLAIGYATMRDREKAFAWLERSADVPADNVLYPHLTPGLEPLHDDRRWSVFLKRFGLLPEQLERIRLDVVVPGVGD